MAKFGATLASNSLVGSEKKQMNGMLKCFLISLTAALIAFVPYIIRDGGYFLYYGDFNVQQLPFYCMAHNAIKGGDIFWNWYTDLGASFIPGYSFSLITSPFFMLTLLFPNGAVPYLIGPLLILKFSLASVTAYAFIKRFVKNSDNAIIASLLYAFSGYSTFNIFFNNFHESMIFFPLLLLGLELYIQDGKRGYFAAAVFLNAFVNYFFFAEMVVFVIIYWFVRLGKDSFKISLRNFFLLAFEAVIGVGMAMVILLPVILVISQNPRLDGGLVGWNNILYSQPQRYLQILGFMFFPPDLAARSNFFPDAGAKWGSVAGWLPFVSMSGVIAWMKSKRKSWETLLLRICIVIAFVPFLNSAFAMFTSAYYARWFFMPILIMCIVTAQGMEDETVDLQKGIKIAGIITIIFTLVLGFTPNGKNSEGKQVFGITSVPSRFWAFAIVATVSVVAFYFIFKKFKNNRKQLSTITLACVFAISAIYTSMINYVAKDPKLSDIAYKTVKPYALNFGKDIDLPDTRNCRMDIRHGSDKGLDNMGMFWEIPSIQAFHSVVPASIMEFYPKLGVERSVGSRPENEYFGLRAFLSVRWHFNSVKSGVGMDGFKYYGQQNGYYVFENENYIPFGFTYTDYITESQFEKLTKAQKDVTLTKALILNDEVAKKYSSTLNALDVSKADFSYEAFQKDCAHRNLSSAKNFERDNKGFSATIDMSKENLVVFTVPYEKGWTATVNGEKADIVKVDYGFMAVKCPKGKDVQIRFNFMTDGLKLGIVLSILSILLFVAYIFIMKKVDKTHPDAITSSKNSIKEEDRVTQKDEFVVKLAEDKNNVKINDHTGEKSEKL